MSFVVRIVCETEVGDGKGWHYKHITQEVIDENCSCSDHPSANTRDFVVEKEVPAE